MNEQEDNALSIHTCIQYTLVVFETRHTKVVFLLQTTTCVTGMSETQNRYVIKMSAHFSATFLTTKKSFLYVRWHFITFGSA